jgi:hypothetical protein
MTREDIIRMALDAGAEQFEIGGEFDSFVTAFANLVAEAERKKLQGQIETLGAMYELASKQRDQLMDEQRAQIAAMRGRVQ